MRRTLPLLAPLLLASVQPRGGCGEAQPQLELRFLVHDEAYAGEALPIELVMVNVGSEGAWALPPHLLSQRETPPRAPQVQVRGFQDGSLVFPHCERPGVTCSTCSFGAVEPVVRKEHFVWLEPDESMHVWGISAEALERHGPLPDVHGGLEPGNYDFKGLYDAHPRFFSGLAESTATAAQRADLPGSPLTARLRLSVHPAR